MTATYLLKLNALDRAHTLSTTGITRTHQNSTKTSAMKKLLSKIKSLFYRPKKEKSVSELFNKLNDIAKEYGTRCSALSISKHSIEHQDREFISIHVHTFRKCEGIKVEVDEPFEDKVIATFKLMLIKDYGKNQRYL